MKLLRFGRGWRCDDDDDDVDDDDDGCVCDRNVA